MYAQDQIRRRLLYVIIMDLDLDGLTVFNFAIARLFERSE